MRCLVFSMAASDWVTGIQEGYRTKTIQVGNVTVEIHRPILTDVEQSKRENQVKDALMVFARATEKGVPQ